MKKYLFYLIVLTAFSLNTNAQSVDKLKLAMHQADSVYKTENYKEALELFSNIGRCSAAKGTSKERSLYYASQIKAAMCCYNLKQAEQGMKICEPLLKTELDNALKTELKEAYVLNGLSRVYSMLLEKNTDIDETRSLISRIMPYTDDDTRKTALKRLQYTYLLEGIEYSKKLNDSKALECLRKAYDVSDDVVQRVKILEYMAEMYKSVCQWDKSVACYDKLRELAKTSNNCGFEHSRALYGEREVYRELNDMESYAKLGLEIDSLVQNSNDRNVLMDYYIKTGQEYTNLGEFDRAETYYNRYMEFVNLEEDPASKGALSSRYFSYMRDLKYKQKKYSEAVSYCKKLRKWYDEYYGPATYIKYTSFFIESEIVAEAKDSVAFENCCDSLRYSYDLMPSTYLKSLVYNFIGTGYSKFGNGAKALEYFCKSDSVLAQEYPETFDLRMLLLQLRAGAYKQKGDFTEAIALYEKNAEMTKNMFGEKSEQYSNALSMLAATEWRFTDSEVFIGHYSESMKILEDIIRKQLRYVTSIQRESYIKSITKRTWTMLAFSIEKNVKDEAYIRQCYNNILTLKSLVFESDRSMYNTLQSKGTPEDVDKFVSLSTLRSRTNALYKDFEKNKNLIDENMIKIRELDNELSLKSQAYKDYTSFLDFKYGDVCDQLGKKDVLFDFFDFIDRKDVHRYVAYVIKKDNPAPIIVDMFSEEEFNKITAGTNNDALYAVNQSDNVIKLLWSKIKPYAEKDGCVYYVPAGVLYQVSFESLPLADGSLLSEHYNFIRLTSARQLADSRRGFEGEKKAVLYGGLKYDMDITEMSAESKKFDNSSLLALRSVARGNSSFNYLSNTLDETHSIGSILESKGYDVEYYNGNEGTEESFLNMHNKSPQILHLATHGFYYTPEEAGSTTFLKGSSDAMLLSGLVFSGGNAAWTGKELPEGVLGGILSASNISCMDLSNINLAVLSACRTGQGHVTNEGIFGLQRAFKKAGVKTMVMTLWDVSDVVTSEFMIEFYRNLFKNKKSMLDKHKAFNKAKKTIRKKYPEPLYWAGFVMVD